MESAFSACFGGMFRAPASGLAGETELPHANDMLPETEHSLQRADVCEDLDEWLAGSMASLSFGGGAGGECDRDVSSGGGDGAGLFGLLATAASAGMVGIDTPTPSLDHAEMDLDGLPSLSSLDLDRFLETCGDANKDLDMNDVAEPVQTQETASQAASEIGATIPASAATAAAAAASAAALLGSSYHATNRFAPGGMASPLARRRSHALPISTSASVDPDFVFARPPAPSETLLDGTPPLSAFARLSRGDVRTSGRDQPHSRRRADSSVSSSGGQRSMSGSGHGSGGDGSSGNGSSGSGSDENRSSFESNCTNAGVAVEEQHADDDKDKANDNGELRTDTEDSDSGAGGLVHGDTPEDISLAAAVKDINSLREETGLATDVKISTMTVLVMLNYRVKLAQLFDHYDEIGLAAHGFEMGQGGRRFNNCVTLLGKGVVPPPEASSAAASAGSSAGGQDTNGSTGAASLAIKIFSNGNLHLAGVRSVRTALDYASLVCLMLDRLRERVSGHRSANANPTGASGSSSTARVYRIASWNVTLINAYYRMALPERGSIDLGKLQQAVMRHTPHYVAVNSDAHAGATIRMLYEGVQRISVMVFESGNVLISAFINAAQLREAFRFITGFIKTHYGTVVRSGIGSNQLPPAETDPATRTSLGDVPARHCKRRRVATGGASGAAGMGAGLASGFDYGRFMVLK